MDLSDKGLEQLRDALSHASEPALQRVAIKKLIGLFSETELTIGTVDCCELLAVSPERSAPFTRAAHFLLASCRPDGLQEALEVHLPNLDLDCSAYSPADHTYLTGLANGLFYSNVPDALAVAARRWAATSTQPPRWVEAALDEMVGELRFMYLDSWADLEAWSSDYWETLDAAVAELAQGRGPIFAYMALEVLGGRHDEVAEDRAIAADFIGLLAHDAPELAKEMGLADGLLAVVHSDGTDLSAVSTLGMSVARALGCFTWMPHAERTEILGALAILQASRSEQVRDEALEALVRLAQPVDQQTHPTIGLEPDSASLLEIDARFSDVLGLYRWQRDALKGWVDGGRCGVIEAVTGAGKTRLALAVIAEAVALGQPVAILVPGLQLLDQWRGEIEHQLRDRAGLRFSIGELHGDADDTLATCDVLLATLQSAARRDLKPPANDGVLIVDEVHRAGAPSWSVALDPRFVERLGLTATYEREGDLGIEEHLDPYFGGVCASVGYGEALRDGVIAPFKVAYVGVRFTPSEQLEYDEVAHRAATLRHQLIADWGCPAEPFGVYLKAVHRLSASGVPEGSRLAGFYLSAFSKRRSVLSNAAGKIDRLQDLVPAVRDADKTIVFTQTKQAATEAVAALADGQIDGAVLHAGMDLDARAQVFGGFEDGTHELVAAPRLLDEGVDVPAADLGLVLAASRSRRQMIQRMGRILRRKTDGRPARFVIMFVEDSSEDPDQPGHEGFLELITPHALDVQRFDGTTAVRTVNDYLHPRSTSASSPAEPDSPSSSWSDVADPTEGHEHPAVSLLNRGIALGDAGRNDEAMGVYDEVVGRFGNDHAPVVRALVAMTLLLKGMTLEDAGRNDEAMGSYEEVVGRFGDDPTPEVREQVVKGWLYKADTLQEAGRGDEAIGVCDEMVARFGDDHNPLVREQVAAALINKGVKLEEAGRADEELGVYDEVVARFGLDDTPPVREQVAIALRNKGITLGEAGRPDEAIEVYHEMVARFGDDHNPLVREQLALALLNKSEALEKAGRADEELGVYDELVARFGQDDTPAIREIVALARELREVGESLEWLGRCRTESSNEGSRTGHDDSPR